ncbi:alpha/beta hydrolase-fold protein [Gordonia iterans]
MPALNPWGRQFGRTANLALIDAPPPPLTPALDDDPDDPSHQRVTLAYDGAPDAAGVFAWVNRITEGPRAADGQMRRDRSGRWSTEFRVPRGAMASYRFYVCADDDPAFVDGRVHFSRAVARGAVNDPANADSVASPFGSVLRTDGAPDLSRWRRTGRPAIALAAAGPLDADPDSGDPVRWRLTEPIGRDAPGPPRLVVLFDAGVWFDRCDLPGVLARSRLRRPVALLGIDAPAQPASRLRLLGANRDVLRAVAELLDRARRRLGWDRCPAVWAGQSLGGLSALAAAAWFPDAVDEVLAYSPSMWWRPGLTARPADFTGERSWIADELAAAGGDHGARARVHVAVGDYEDLLVEPVEALADELAAAGLPVRSTRYAGGHDLPWWAHLLWRDLSEN